MARRRRRNLKKTNKLWIFCEGKTEKLYFQNLSAIVRARIKIVPQEARVSRADQILEKAIKFRKGGFDINGDKFDAERDVIACVFDKDDNNTPAVFAKIRANSTGITIGYSNPCFEYWILCHHGYYPTPSYNQSQVYEKVKEKLGLDTKVETELYEKTKDKIDVAKTHSKRIQKKHEDDNVELISRDSTPLSLIYQIIEIVDEFR